MGAVNEQEFSGSRQQQRLAIPETIESDEHSEFKRCFPNWEERCPDPQRTYQESCNNNNFLTEQALFFCRLFKLMQLDPHSNDQKPQVFDLLYNHRLALRIAVQEKVFLVELSQIPPNWVITVLQAIERECEDSAFQMLSNKDITRDQFNNYTENNKDIVEKIIENPANSETIAQSITDACRHRVESCAMQ